MTQILSVEPKPREISDRVNLILKGGLNNTGSVTLTASTTTTTVLNPIVHSLSTVFLFPQTANAATETQTAYILSTNITSGQFIITHANAASTDRTFSYIVLG